MEGRCTALFWMFAFEVMSSWQTEILKSGAQRRVLELVLRAVRRWMGVVAAETIGVERQSQGK